MTRNFDTTSPRSDQGSEIALSKIEKLWRTASDGAATDAEREAARNRALHLMAKYHIDDAQLAAGRADADEIVEAEITDTLTGGYRAPFEHLFGVVCESFTCRAIFWTLGNTSKGLALGHAGDTERVKALWAWLYADCAAGMAGIRGHNAGDTRRRRRNFAFGYVETVARRLRAAMDDVLADAEAEAAASGGDAGGTSTALVLASREEKVAQALADRNLKTMRRSVKQPTMAGYDDGVRAGRTADLDPRRRRLGDLPALG